MEPTLPVVEDPVTRLRALLKDLEEEQGLLSRRLDVVNTSVGALRDLMDKVAPTAPPQIRSPELRREWEERHGIASVSTAPPAEEAQNGHPPVEMHPPARRGRKQGVKFTEEQFRDAIVDLQKNPPPPAPRSNQVRGYFITSQIAERLGVSPSNDILSKYMKAYAAKGQLTSRPFKNGRQYRYVLAEEPTPPRPRQPPVEAAFVGTTPLVERRQQVAHRAKMIPKTSSKDVNILLKKAADAGWVIRRDSTNHISCYTMTGPHAGERLGVSSTPGVSAYEAIRSEFRAWGLEC